MDWKKLIDELLRTGFTQSDIAAEIGVKQPTIAGLLSGAQQDMRYAHGERLVRMHKRSIKPMRARRSAKEPVHA